MADKWIIIELWKLFWNGSGSSGLDLSSVQPLLQSTTSTYWEHKRQRLSGHSGAPHTCNMETALINCVRWMLDLGFVHPRHCVYLFMFTICSNVLQQTCMSMLICVCIFLSVTLHDPLLYPTCALMTRGVSFYRTYCLPYFSGIFEWYVETMGSHVVVKRCFWERDRCTVST